MTDPLYDPVWPRLAKLTQCICDGLDTHGQVPTCFCGVIAGATVALDYIANESCLDGNTDGMAWVRLAGVYQSNSFPQPMATFTTCGTGMAMSAEAGIIRTVVGTNEEGLPPNPDEQLVMAARQVDEMLILREAILCCYGGDVVLGNWQPVGQQGLAVGGFWSFTASLEDEAV